MHRTDCVYHVLHGWIAGGDERETHMNTPTADDPRAAVEPPVGRVRLLGLGRVPGDVGEHRRARAAGLGGLAGQDR